MPIFAPIEKHKLAIRKAVALIGSGVLLLGVFPEYARCTMIVVIAFALEPVVVREFRPLVWSVIGGVVGYLSMTIAFNMRLFVFSYPFPHWRQPLVAGHYLLHFFSVFAPLLALVKFYRPGERRLAFATFCTLGAGSLAYYLRGRSTSWMHDLSEEYAHVTWGCCIGAFAAAFAIGVWDGIYRDSSGDDFE